MSRHLSSIATLILQARSAAGETFELRVDIGAPMPAGGDEWLCPLSIAPLPQYRTLRDTRGTSAFQTLSLAVDYARVCLEAFVADGGELRLEDEIFDVSYCRLRDR